MLWCVPLGSREHTTQDKGHQVCSVEACCLNLTGQKKYVSEEGTWKHSGRSGFLMKTEIFHGFYFLRTGGDIGNQLLAFIHFTLV